MKRFLVLSLAALLAACAPAAAGTGAPAGAPASASSAPAAAGPTLDATSYPTMQAAQSVATQGVSGFNVALQRAWRDGKTVFADVCFTLPDPSDWTIWSAHFDYTTSSVTDFSAALLSTKAASDGQPGQRCDEISFYVPPDADLTAASITIESLGAYPTPDEYCSLYMPKIQQAMDPRGTGITLGCAADANGGQTMQITGKPASMSPEDAQKLVYSDEFYTVKGPWRFATNLGQ